MMDRPGGLLAPALALLLSSCAAVGPDYRPAASNAPAAFSQRPPGLEAGDVEAAWWRTFGDPELDRLVQAALAANHDVGIAVARVEQARALLAEARRQGFPTGGLGASVEARRLSDVERAGGLPETIESYRGAVDAAWEIDLFGRVRRSAEAAAADLGSAAALLRAAQASVVAETARTYFAVRGAEAELAVLDRLLRTQEESLRVVERLQAAGSGSELDRIRAEAQLRGVGALAPEVRRRERTGLHALAILTGEPPGAVALSPIADAAEARIEVRTIPVGDPGALIARRPDVAAAERRLAAATARIGVATADLYPSVELRGSIGVLAGELGDLASGGAVSSFIAPVLRWAFLDAGRVRARIAAGEARAREALAAYDQAVLRALQEAEDSFAAHASANEEALLRAGEAAANREAARLARVRFAAGEGGFLEVLDAERSDVASQRAATIARTRQQLAVVDVHRALGGGWAPCAEGALDCSGAGASRPLRARKRFAGS